MAQPDFTVEQLDPKGLLANPLNFRRHPELQKTALRQSLEEFGWVDGPIWNATTARLIDGHLRVEEAVREGRKTIPVKVVNLTEEQERRLLRLFDPLTAMAEEDTEVLDRLIAEIDDWDYEQLLGSEDAPEPGAPEGFPEVDENIDTEHQCPKCGYTWSGKSS